MKELAPIQNFLACETPDSWVQWALDNQPLLLLDHANCEKKAASTALTLMYRYVGDTLASGRWKRLSLLLLDHANCEKKAASTALTLMYRYVGDFDMMHKMSRLAREELRHYEQVMSLMQTRGIAYEQITPCRYASELRKPVRTHEPARFIDTLIVGAIIEARSCERFAKIAPHLDEELEKFYLSLLKSEARHYQDYLKLAQKAAGENAIEDRLEVFLTLEKSLIQSPDEVFRFHSGVPAADLSLAS